MFSDKLKLISSCRLPLIICIKPRFMGSIQIEVLHVSCFRLKYLLVVCKKTGLKNSSIFEKISSVSGSGSFEVLLLHLLLGNWSGTNFGASQCIPMGSWRLTLGVFIPLLVNNILSFYLKLNLFTAMYHHFTLISPAVYNLTYELTIYLLLTQLWCEFISQISCYLKISCCSRLHHNNLLYRAGMSFFTFGRGEVMLYGDTIHHLHLPWVSNPYHLCSSAEC